MNKESIVELITNKIKLVRIEKGYTQDQMAEVIGLSKKTLVQIEKGRASAGWTTAVAICALFQDSEIIRSSLGDDALEVVETIAHDEVSRRKEQTMGGKIWWTELAKQNGFRLQQNMVTQHYRIIDDEHFRWYSSFNKEETLTQFAALAKQTTRGEQQV